MNKYHDLVNKVDLFCKLATYGSRRSFLEKISQSYYTNIKVQPTHVQAAKNIAALLVMAMNQLHSGVADFNYLDNSISSLVSTLSQASTGDSLEWLMSQLNGVVSLQKEVNESSAGLSPSAQHQFGGLSKAINAAQKLLASIKSVYTSTPSAQAQVLPPEGQRAQALIKSVDSIMGSALGQNSPELNDKLRELNNMFGIVRMSLNEAKQAMNPENPYYSEAENKAASEKISQLTPILNQLKQLIDKVSSIQETGAGQATRTRVT